MLVNPYSRRIMEYSLTEPKIISVSACPAEYGSFETMVAGREREDRHAALGFSLLGSLAVAFIVHMTRMQYGNAGRGCFGELYFLGSEREYLDSMGEICGNVEQVGKGACDVFESEHTELLKACAKRVLERWEKKDEVGWCEYCGVGAAEKSLGKCSGCKKVAVRYYCMEHQKSAWKLHKFTCERSK